MLGAYLISWAAGPLDMRPLLGRQAMAMAKVFCFAVLVTQICFSATLGKLLWSQKIRTGGFHSHGVYQKLLVYFKENPIIK